MCFHILQQFDFQLPNATINVAQLNLVSPGPLSDPDFFKPNEIDLIIGAEHFYNLVIGGQVKSSENGPVLQNTRFGWMVAGPLPGPDTYQVSVTHVCSTSSLQQQRTKLAEKECKATFETTRKISTDKRNIMNRISEARTALNPEQPLQYITFTMHDEVSRKKRKDISDENYINSLPYPVEHKPSAREEQRRPLGLHPGKSISNIVFRLKKHPLILPGHKSHHRNRHRSKTYHTHEHKVIRQPRMHKEGRKEEKEQLTRLPTSRAQQESRHPWHGGLVDESSSTAHGIMSAAEKSSRRARRPSEQQHQYHKCAAEVRLPKARWPGRETTTIPHTGET